MEKTLLSFQKIKEKVEKPKNKTNLLKARKHATRARLHTERFLDRDSAGESLTQFMDWVKSFLHENKMQNFETFFRFPVDTNKLTGAIKDELGKCFEANDRNFFHTFQNEEKASEFQDYLSEKGIRNFVKEQVFPRYFSSPNDFIVINQPEELKSPPEPYAYIVSIFDVVDYWNLNATQVDYVIWQSDDEIYAIDCYNYYKIDKSEDGDLIESSYQEIAIDEGAKVVRQISPYLLDCQNFQIKEGPISMVLSDLDKYLFKDVSKFDSDLYILYPMFWMYEQKCSYDSYEGKIECKAGKMFGETIDNNGQTLQWVKECECAKSKKALRGAGSTIEIEPPMDNSEPDLRDPIGIKTVDAFVSDNIQKDLDHKKAEILHSVLGKDTMDDSKQHNELRVMGSFESRQNVLQKTANTFANIEKFIYQAFGKLRYSDYKGSTVNAGSNFFIHTADQMQEQFKLASESGMPFYQKIIGKKLVETEFKNDPESLERERIKQLLNPFYFMAPEVLENNRASLSDQDYFFYKLFDSLVQNFEAETTTLDKVASESDITERLRIIKEGLLLILQNYGLYTTANPGEATA